MKRLLFIVVAFLALNYSNAIDNTSMKFEQLSVDQGLSQSIVEDIFQDSKGFIWVATRDGLNKYDGKNFVVFRNDRNDTNSLYNNWVLSINEDSKGNIWIGTYDGINIFSYELNKMIRIPNSENFHGGRIFDFEPDGENTMWIATSIGLVKCNTETLELDILNGYLGKELREASISVFDIEITENGRMFFTIEADPVIEYDRKNKEFIIHEYNNDFKGAYFKKTITEDYNGLLYIGAEGEMVHVYNPKTKQSHLLSGLNNTTVKTNVLPISKSEIWIGTDGGGINIYYPETDTYEFLLSDSKKKGTIFGNAIFDLFRDRDGNIWIGHYGAGISIWKKYKEKFQSFQHNPFIPSTLNKEVVTSVFQDSKGRLWIGQDGGGLDLYNPESNDFTHYRHNPDDESTLNSDVIISINEDPNGNLLIGTYNGGLMVFNPETGKRVKTYYIDNGMGANHVWHIAVDSKGRYWLATLGSGVDLFDPVKETFKKFSNNGTETLICSNVIMHIVEDPDGNMWFGSEGQGLCVFNPEEGTIKNYSYNQDDINTISANDIKCILFQKHYAWIATNGGGLNRINLKTNDIKVYTIKDGLSSNALMGMLFDDDQNLWISSTNGLMKFSTITEEVIVYDKTQGLQGNEFKYNAQYKLSDGRMVFGGVSGLNIFNPDSIKSSPIVSSVLFTDFLVFDESVKVNGEDGILKHHINETDFIKLKYKARVFTIEFASLDYTSPVKNKFKYMLEGFDVGWIDPGIANSATYTNLAPGSYTFKLMGSNSDGEWNPTIREIKIRKRPPFYLTKIFILFCVISIAFIVYLFVKQRVRQAKHDKEVLQRKIDEGKAELNIRIQEIDKQKEEIKEREEREKELQFSNTGIVKFSEIIAKNRENINDLSQEVISTLIEYVEANAGVLYLARVENASVKLEPTATYCFDTKSETSDTVLPGEGYIGTCYNSKEILFVDDMPDNMIVLSSGLGELSIHNLVYIPIMHDIDCLGVIEVASLDRLLEYKLSFISKVAESLGAVYAIDKANRVTTTMLEQNKQQSEELQAQEEELRQNLEEMQATQEDFQRKLDSADKIKAELAEAKKTIRAFKGKSS